MTTRRILAVSLGVLLIGGLVLVNAGGGVPSAAAWGDGNNNGNGTMQCNREGTSCWPVLDYGNGNGGNHGHPPTPPAGNPLTKILEKLDEILTAIGGIGGGGGQEGNHTLRWDTNNPSASRFVTAFPGAVLDKNTGLVWEQAPDATSRTWGAATSHCVNRNVGGTWGWRLPSVVELKSVQDPTLPAPFVPASVFTGVQSANYWSASTLADSPSNAWVVPFINGNVNTGIKTGSVQVWCVRGGHNDGSQY